MADDARWTPLGTGVHVRESPTSTLLAVAGTGGVLVHGAASPADLAGLVVDGRTVTAADVTWATSPGLDAPLLLHEDHPLAAEAAHALTSVHALDLDGVYVEVVHPGRGATASDLVVVVPAADVVATGGLVGVPGPPAYSASSWPLDWPATLDLVLATTTDRTRVVPGRGPVTDQAFVEDQRQQVLAVAEQVDVLASRGTTPDQAWSQGTWPWDDAGVRAAVEAAFTQWTPRPQAKHQH